MWRTLKRVLPGEGSTLAFAFVAIAIAPTQGISELVAIARCRLQCQFCNSVRTIATRAVDCTHLGDSCVRTPTASISTLLLEFLALVIALETFAPLFSQKKIFAMCDNKGVIDNLSRRNAGCPKAIALMDRFFTFLILRDFDVIGKHVSGENNTKADLLSRNEIDQYKALHSSNASLSLHKAPSESFFSSIHGADLPPAPFFI